MSFNINDYKQIAGSNEIEEIKLVAGRLEGVRMHNVNSTPSGGGVAEILARLIPLLRGIGIDATWDVIRGSEDFYQVTKAFHNALHGEKINLTDSMFEIFEHYTNLNLDLFDKEADCYLIHDPQPVGLIRKRSVSPASKWIWRCHIDVSRPDESIWGFISEDIEKYDATVFTMPEFSRPIPVPQFLVTPSIDPLADKNKELNGKTVMQVAEKYDLNPERPIITQVSRFDRLKDPIGVIKSYKLVKKRMDCQLVLAGGGAQDDPESCGVLDEIREAAGDDPDIKILELPPFSDIEINALQRASAIILQKSVREGFGLTVTEALWKGVPVIGSAVGGIKAQVINGVTGYLIYSIEGCAHRIEELLRDPEKGKTMGRNGKELVRSRFLITRHLKNYLLLMLALLKTLNRDLFERQIFMLSA
ncbi:MAG: glycosyltransferase [bacterium]